MIILTISKILVVA